MNNSNPETQAKGQILSNLGKMAMKFASNLIPGAVKDVANMAKNEAMLVVDYGKYHMGDVQNKIQAGQDYGPRVKVMNDIFEKYGFSPTDSGDKNQFHPAKFAKKEAQGAVGLAAYAVPFGQGATFATKATIPGMTAGAMNALSQDDATPTSVMESALLGGSLATGLYGAGLFGKALMKSYMPNESADDVLKKGLLEGKEAKMLPDDKFKFLNDVKEMMNPAKDIKIPTARYVTADENVMPPMNFTPLVGHVSDSLLEITRNAQKAAGKKATDPSMMSALQQIMQQMGVHQVSNKNSQ